MTPDTDTRRVSRSELDALVATLVMGWKIEAPHPYVSRAHGVWVPHETGDLQWRDWSPSTDWRHTGELWERLVSEGWRPSIDEWCGAVASVSNNDACNPRGGASGAEDDDGAIDPRVALCLAALRAYGVEVELETGHD